jgi:hypothetical protein
MIGQEDPLRLLERLINLAGWPVIGLGLAHWLFGEAPVPHFAFGAIGLMIGFIMPSLFGRASNKVGTVAQPVGEAGVKPPTAQERS